MTIRYDVAERKPLFKKTIIDTIQRHEQNRVLRFTHVQTAMDVILISSCPARYGQALLDERHVQVLSPRNT